MRDCPTLENCDFFEGPRLGDDLPIGVSIDGGLGVAEVGFVVGPEMQASALPCPLCSCGQKLRLKDAVFLVAAFWPRIREKDIDIGKRYAGGQRIEKIERIGVEEMEVIEFGSVTFSNTALNSIQADVDADTNFVRMRDGVGGEEMPVTAADFPNDWPMISQETCNFNS
ncbi:MAG: hypothetical protein JWM32_1730 [Verrucomicrobia bacterium]|nr:hypothetical protein [Verrucomicrobiota bacterium]